TKIDNEVNTAVTDFGKAAIEQRVIDHEWVSTNNYDGNRVDLFSFEPKFSQGILSLYQFQIPDGYIF
ncbi:hypothetical protein, partial [Phenylobacterium sp. Root700]|uniref:hypothetical protein n=1 Tax=Phenylobacterium sp. Root700 TaxID=1736591 RepID=UPI001F30CD44